MGKKTQLHRNAAMYKSIPYLCCFEEGGMIETEPGVYSRSYQILQPEKEAKYSITTRQIRAAMENIIQKLAERFTFQFSLCSSHIEQEDFLKGVEMRAPSQTDGDLTISAAADTTRRRLRRRLEAGWTMTTGGSLSSPCCG